MILTWGVHTTPAGPSRPLTAMEGEAERPDPLPPGPAATTSPPRVLCSGDSPWDAVWGPPFAQRQDRQQSLPWAGHRRRGVEQPLFKLATANEANGGYCIPHFGNAAGIYVPASGILWLREDLINFQPENGVGEMKANPSGFTEKLTKYHPKRIREKLKRKTRGLFFLIPSSP